MQCLRIPSGHRANILLLWRGVLPFMFRKNWISANPNNAELGTKAQAVVYTFHVVQVCPHLHQQAVMIKHIVQAPGAPATTSRGTAHLTLAAQNGSIEFTGCFLPLSNIHQISQGTLVCIFKGQQGHCAFCRHQNK